MGRHGDPYGETPPWDRGGYPAVAEVPRPRRLRAALLLAVAFVATVTGVIAGVRLLAASQTGAASPAGLGLPCPPNAGCEALFPSEASPSAVETGGPIPEPTATGRAGAGGSGAGQDAGSSGSGRSDSGTAGAGQPTATPPSADPPTVVPSPRVSRTPVVSLSPKPSPTARARDDAGVTRARPSPSTPPPVTRKPTQAPPEDPATARAERAAPAPKKAVVKFTVIRRVNGRYAAEIAIGNEGRGDLKGWEISLPIEGRAFAVDGAAARQHGDILVIRSDELLPPGGGVAVTIAVRGDSIDPGFCRLRGGSCRVL